MPSITRVRVRYKDTDTMRVRGGARFCGVRSNVPRCRPEMRRAAGTPVPNCLARDMLGPLKRLLVKRGNPFFTEERIRTLVETGALAGERGAYRLTRPIHHALLFPARRLAGNGFTAWQQVLNRGYEGLVAKDESSPYRGGRSLSWLKVRQRDYRLEERGWSQSRAGR